jgi:hypothetical protein
MYLVLVVLRYVLFCHGNKRFGQYHVCLAHDGSLGTVIQIETKMYFHEMLKFICGLFGKIQILSFLRKYFYFFRAFWQVFPKIFNLFLREF